MMDKRTYLKHAHDKTCRCVDCGDEHASNWRDDPSATAERERVVVWLAIGKRGGIPGWMGDVFESEEDARKWSAPNKQFLPVEIPRALATSTG